jgi:hypothetical protein
MSGCPGNLREFRSMRQRGPTDSRTKKYRAFSTVVPVLLIRDMISLRFFAVKISANSTNLSGQFGFDSLLVDARWGKIRWSCKG